MPWNRLPIGSCFHGISRSLKLPIRVSIEQIGHSLSISDRDS